MASTPKVLGQLDSALTTLETVYLVPALTNTVISTITMANRTGSAIAIRLAIRPAAAAISNEMYIYYDVSIPANDTLALTLGITLEATDDIQVYCDTAAALSTNVFGTEIT